MISDDFEKFWDRKALERKGLDNLVWFIPTKKYLFSKIDFKNKTILDLGCGDSIIPMDFIDRSSRYIGIDISSEMLKKARINMPFGIFHKRECNNLDYIEDNSIDLILSFGFLQYVKDLHKIINEINKKLKPNGLSILREPLEKGQVIEGEYKISFNNLKNLLENSGLKITRKFYQNCVLTNKFFSVLKIIKMKDFFYESRMLMEIKTVFDKTISSAPIFKTKDVFLICKKVF